MATSLACARSLHVHKVIMTRTDLATLFAASLRQIVTPVPTDGDHQNEGAIRSIHFYSFPSSWRRKREKKREEKKRT